MEQVMLAGGRVSAAVAGPNAGPPIVLLHSLLADASSFHPLAALLAARGARVVVPALPGFAGSAPAPGGLPAVADRVAEALDGLGTPVVIGNGYGSFVALTLALRRPHAVSRLVLAGTGARFDEPGRAAFRTMAHAARAGGLQAIADVAMRRLFAPAFQAENPALLDACRARFLATDPAIFLDACEALATLDLRAAIVDFALPVLIVVGADDAATPPAMAMELAELLPEARLVIMPDCAHVPQLQDPPRFLAEIAAFAGLRADV
jgi:3-oxoadipate enol-lactonase